jgi:hypothetical protein
LIFKISSTYFGQTFVHQQERKTANYSMLYGVLLYWWVGGQESGSVVLCAWCEGRCLTGIFLHTANPPLQQDTITHAVILQSHAPDVGQMFVRNMLS